MRLATFMKTSNPRIDSSPREGERHHPRSFGYRTPADLPPRATRAVQARCRCHRSVLQSWNEISWETTVSAMRWPSSRHIAVDQRCQRRGVDRAGEKRRGLGRRQIDTVRNVAMAPRKVVFTVNDDRALDDFAQEQTRRASAPVGDDQVRAQVRHRPDRVVDRLALVEIVAENLRPGNAVARSMLNKLQAP